jgi:tetratricopeptide (TPR) repeat protein
MRLLEGGSLVEHLGRFRDDPKAAARLVAAVARAVHHAHQRGVLHRDLKPSNILLDGAGAPHVTDFGLARRVQTDSALTQTGALVGTPSYMAPEQTTGAKGAVTTAADVYGLGGVLYALLTGRPPVQGETILDTMMQAREAAPEPPSRRNRKVERDLETICLKCLEKEPARRYGTAEALAEDLRRFLEYEPIQAQRPGLLARAQKWARRHRSVVRALGVGLVVAVVALAASTVWAWHKEKQAQDARQYADEQRHLAVNNAAAADEQRRRADQNFRQAVRVVVGLVNERFDPGAGVDLEAMRSRMPDVAIPLIQELLRGGTPTNPEGRRLTAQAYEGLGTAHMMRGELVEAVRAYVRARDIFAELAAEYPGEHTYKHEMVRIHERRIKDLRPFNLAQKYADLGLHEQAANSFRCCLRIDEISAGTEINAHMTLIDQAFCGVRLAEALRALGRRQEAEQAYGEAVVSCDSLARYPAKQVYPVFAVALQARARASRGLLLAESGRLEAADKDLREALDLADRLKPDELQLAMGILHDRARVRSALGNVLWAEGRRQEATDLFRAAEKEWRQARSTPVRDNQLAWFLATCPDTQFRNAKEAVELAKQAVKGVPEGEPWRAMGVIDWRASECRRTLAVALYRAGDWNGASEALKKAGALFGKEWGPYRQEGVDPDDSETWFFLAMTEWQLGRKEGAQQQYDGAVRSMKTHRPKDEDLRRFRDEAAHLLGIEEKKD